MDKFKFQEYTSVIIVEKNLDLRDQQQAVYQKQGFF